MSHDNSRPDRGFSRADLFCAAVLVVLLGLLYLPQFFRGRTAMDTPEKMDVTSQWYPGYTAVGAHWRAGYFPLWNPNRYAGMPWLAYSHAAGMYPPNALLLSAFDFMDAVTWLHFLHALLAALGLYALLRGLGARPTLSLPMALAFACGGFFFYLQSQLSNHATIAWVPLMLYSIRRLLIEPRLRWMVLIGAVTSLMIYGGDLEGFTYTAIFIFFFIVFVLRRETTGHPAALLLLAACSIGLGLVLASPLAFSVLEHVALSVRSKASPFQLDYAGLFGSWYKYPHLALFPWKHFTEMHPTAAYNNGVSPFYIGTLPLVLVFLAASQYRRDPKVRGLLNTALAMAVFLIVRKIEFLDPVFARIPIIGQLATVERSIELIELALVISGGLALDRLLDSREPGPTLKKLGLAVAAFGVANLALAPLMVGPASRYAAGAIMLGVGAAGFIASKKSAGRRGLMAAAAIFLIIGDVYLLALAAVPRTPKSAFALDPGVIRFLKGRDQDYRFISFEKTDPENASPELFGLVTAATRLDYPFGHMRLPTWRYFEFLHLLDPGVTRDWSEIFFNAPNPKKQFYTADLFGPAFLDNRNLDLLDLLSVRYVFARGVSFKFSSPFPLMNREATPGGGIRPLPRRGDRPAAYMFRDRGRAAMSSGLPLFSSFETWVYPGDVLAFEMRPEGEAPWQAAVTVSGSESGMAELGILASKNLEAEAGEASEFPIRVPLDSLAGTNADIRIAVSSPRPDERAVLIDARIIRREAHFERAVPGVVDIYENPHALARVRILHRSAVLSPDQARELMADPAQFDPANVIVFETGEAPENLVELAQMTRRPGSDEVIMEEHGFEEVRARARLSSPGWFFISDAYYPGWRAWTDGTETRIYRADLAFRALFLTEDAHEVHLGFQPAAFRVGLWAVIASLVFLLVLAAARRGRMLAG